MVIYGNTAEDLGQFNIEVDLDSTLNNLVSSSESKLDDLPPALHLKDLTIEDSISSINSLQLVVPPTYMSTEMKQLLQLSLRIFELPNLGDTVEGLINIVVSAAASYAASERLHETPNQTDMAQEKLMPYQLTQAQQDLLSLMQKLHESGYISAELLAEFTFLESDGNLVASKQLMDMFTQFLQHINTIDHPLLSKHTKTNLLFSMALLLCSNKEGCYHFVNGGAMEELVGSFCSHLHESTATTLLALGFVEQATRYSVGCEGFLSWWPRDDENIPSGESEGYSQLVKLLLQHQSHDVASHATYLLQRLRLYEVASRYECAVLSLIGNLSATGQVSSASLDFLGNAKSQLKSLLKLLMARDPIEDPSSVASASRSLILGQTEGLLSYTATCRLIMNSKDRYPSSDIDVHLLSLLKERGFLPLSAALLSSPQLRSEVGRVMDIFVDIASLIQAIILSLLSCRSGLTFLAHHPELTASLVLALRGVDDVSKEESVPLRYASVLLSKGFVCRPTEVGIIIEMHLRAVRAVDRLLSTTPQTEEFLWVLWELCGLSRADCGRQALLALALFPEAVTVLLEALQSVTEVDTGNLSTGVSPVNLAIFHSAAEIFEVIVGDSAAYSMSSWIEHALELHTALHSSSSGSNRKDAPARLLDWIDAGAVYHKYGGSGLLRYAAVLASGGDAHLSSSSLLVSDSADLENSVGDSSSGSDGLVLENLSKTVAEKSYDGVTLRDSSIAQLTTGFRILAFLAENSAVAAALYDEGAVTVIYAVIVNCRLMFERSSNTYDYLVDDGTESNSTSDLLVERNREKSLVDLLIPSLVLLVKLLQKLQESKEQYRNTKLMNALLRLHREVSPKLAACAAESSSPYCESALNFASVCHLIVSALACWPIHGWTPGLFHSITENLQATSVLALGPKETCSLLCLLNDLFPEEGIRLWKNGMPLLTGVRTLAVGTVLGHQGETVVDWHLAPRHFETLLSQLQTHLEKIAEVFLHYAFSTLVVIQDLLRALIVRIAYQKPDYASVLLHPLFVWLQDHLSQFASLSDVDSFKIQRLLEFLASVLEHPRTKPLLLKEGLIQILANALERCTQAFMVDGDQLSEDLGSGIIGFSPYKWCIPIFRSLVLLSLSYTYPPNPRGFKKENWRNLDADDFLLIIPYLLKLFQVLPTGCELLACVVAFKEAVSTDDGQRALTIFCSRICSAGEDFEYEDENKFEGRLNLFEKTQWLRNPPLLCCWKKLLASVESNDSTLPGGIDAILVFCTGALKFSFEGNNLKTERIAALRCLFGLLDDGGESSFVDENMKNIEQMIVSLSSKTSSNASSTSYLIAVEHLISVLLMEEDQEVSVNVNEILSNVLPASNDPHSSLKLLQTADGNSQRVDSLSCIGELADTFLWECPEALPDRLSQASPSLKRKMASIDGPNRRSRLDNSPSDSLAPNSFARGGPLPVSSGPSRRDNFRQRKPNTSRPPSMHVDDYVARERNVDINSGSNVIAVQRVGSSGRPPSIHVDEFMARQKERLNPVVGAAGDSTVRSKPLVTSASKPGEEKSSNCQLLKADPDDDLQGINIVFDGEESEADDKLPFPQLDDNLQQLGPGVVGSPHSVVAETESEANENNQPAQSAMPTTSNMDEHAQRSRGHHDQRYMIGQPPLPPMPPPPTVSPIMSKGSFTGSNTEPTAFHVQPDPNYLRTLPTSASGSIRPPLPPTPPPYASTSSFSMPLQKPSASQSSGAPADPRTSNHLVSGARIPSYPPQLAQPLVYSRPMSAPMSVFGSPPNQRLGENSNVVQNQMFAQATLQSGQSLIQLQPLQPPQLTRPPHPPQHIRPNIQHQQQSDAGGSLHQSPLQMQMLQQLQPSPANVYYNSQQHLEVAQQPIHQPDESSTQQDSGFNLQQFFSSPEAIQSLLSDRDKLCQLLEQHPKLMQMLQVQYYLESFLMTFIIPF
uniref:Virilizer N-terminal domain-containing protein n=1 Tax=Kalanchoe fedtschenkoi TaxID=63787 RepID=A0A7N0V598_KALFE